MSAWQGGHAVYADRRAELAVSRCPFGILPHRCDAMAALVTLGRSGLPSLRAGCCGFWFWVRGCDDFETKGHSSSSLGHVTLPGRPRRRVKLADYFGIGAESHARVTVQDSHFSGFLRGAYAGENATLSLLRCTLNQNKAEPFPACPAPACCT